ncbi:Alkaline proteinase-like protein 2 [Elsinoe fawcettii]|nr:Alkaline proteinase-like protein 2 [Elsinoe fawcettii]
MRLLGQVGAIAISLYAMAGAIPVRRDDDDSKVADRYVVKLKSDVSIASHIASIQDIQTTNLAKRDDGAAFAGVIHEYELGSFKGYAGQFDPATVAEIKARPDVESVEHDTILYPLGKVTQANAGKGLAAMGNRDPAATSFSYDDSAGAGTWTYIIDSGINVGHADFGGRAYNGAVFTTGVTRPDDIGGHGTFVAGLAGSATYGVAKKTSLIAVKVLETGGAIGSDVKAGFNWAVHDIINNGRASKAVINMSLGGGPDTVFDDLITIAYNYGITVVVAAGNDNVVAAGFPCTAPKAICVGATNGRSRAPYSNYGPNVDIFAEGTDVTSTSHDCNTCSTSASGTSAASPYVAGLVAYLKGLPQNPNGLPVQQTADLVQYLATQNAIYAVGEGSPNRLAWNGGSAIQ